MHTVIHIEDLPEPIRAEAIKRGRRQGPNRIEIDVAMLQHLLRSVPDEPQKIRGLGDIVAMVAQPIAKVIDKMARTNLQNCGRCGRTQSKLNKAFPIKREG